MGISREQALDCFLSDDLVGIGMEADGVRRRLHPEGVVSYIIDRGIDLSGTADEGRSDRIYDEIRETVEMGGTGVRITCGPGSGLDARGIEWFNIEWFDEVFRGIKLRFPSIWLEGLSVAEVMAIAGRCGLGLRETIARLRHSGLDSIAGDAAFSLGHAAADGVRPELSVREWIEVHRTAHELGMRSTATMIFGAGETLEQRVESLEAVRRLQEETGGFTAFVPGFADPRLENGERELDGVTAVEWLKTLAISRMFLDNIENVQASGAGQGLKVLQMGLRFGGNDVGSAMPAGNGAKAGGAASGGSEEDLRRIIRDAGFKPVQRDTLYRTMFLN